jgi:hypothetical protein
VAAGPTVAEVAAVYAQQDGPLAVRRSFSPAEIKHRLELVEELMRETMKLNIDYGRVPGTKVNSLWKSGGELVRLLFGFEVEYDIAQEYDATINLLSLTTTCRLRDEGGTVVGMCMANANSHETKYHYRWVTEHELGPEDDKARLVTALRWKDRQQIPHYQVENKNPYEMLNTLQKMSEKRAFLGAIQNATGCERIFPIIEGEEDTYQGPGAEVGAPRQRQVQPPRAAVNRPAAPVKPAPARPTAPSSQPPAVIKAPPTPEPPAEAGSEAMAAPSDAPQVEYVAPENPGPCNTLEQAFQHIERVFGVSKAKVLNELGVKSENMIAIKPLEVYQQIRAVYQALPPK